MLCVTLQSLLSINPPHTTDLSPEPAVQEQGPGTLASAQLRGWEGGLAAVLRQAQRDGQLTDALVAMAPSGLSWPDAVLEVPE